MHILIVLKFHYWAGLGHLQFLVPVAPSSLISPTPLPLRHSGNEHHLGTVFLQWEGGTLPHLQPSVFLGSFFSSPAEEN